MAITKKADEVVEIIEVAQEEHTYCIVGTTPLIMNRPSEKAKHELLFPEAKATKRSKRDEVLKHEPLKEYRASAYTLPGEFTPTLLGFPSNGFKAAMRSAALDMPGSSKAQTGRSVYVNGDYINVYGVPELFMTIVRSADMSRTPDVRTRLILSRWACKVTVTITLPMMRPQMATRLLAAAGMMIGLGDFRNEKGAGNYGLFKIVSPNDPEFLAIVSAGDRAAQVRALEAPATYDQETADLLSWFDTELESRKLKGVA